ncbi:type II toxin-antitoxin system death-on-curing family toxin [Patescibacteria group bacterium]|nr:type II toxin-antitoxin system death-on-curing family toxin [Patescibacteria group bacterium]
MTKDISIKELEYVVFSLARDLMTYNEPIPDFATRFSGVLESCLAVPFQRFEKKSLYITIDQKAAALFYLMIKNHPFQNGNKRIAMTTLLYFFFKNKKWLRVDEKKFYNFAVWIAESPAELKKETLEAASRFIRTHTVVLE